MAYFKLINKFLLVKTKNLIIFSNLNFFYFPKKEGISLLLMLILINS